jgi:hypothetical protein
VRRRFLSILAAGSLAVIATAAFAAPPAAAFHKHYGGHSRGHFDGYPYGQPHYGPHYAYGYGPAYYPPAYPPAYPVAYPAAYPAAYPVTYVAPPPAVIAPPPVIVAPVVAAPVAADPVVAGPVLPAPIPTALPTNLPPAAAVYSADPMAPGMEGAPGCLVVREYTTEIEVGGDAVEGYGYACLQADGSWKRGAPAPVR